MKQEKIRKIMIDQIFLVMMLVIEVMMEILMISQLLQNQLTQKN